eukprot:394710-Rhodomonas_salina.1
MELTARLKFEATPEFQAEEEQRIGLVAAEQMRETALGSTSVDKVAYTSSVIVIACQEKNSS